MKYRITPGPWRIDPDRSTEANYEIQSAEYSSGNRYFVAGEIANYEDAALIAAAPAIVEAFWRLARSHADLEARNTELREELHQKAPKSTNMAAVVEIVGKELYDLIPKSDTGQSDTPEGTAFHSVSESLQRESDYFREKEDRA